MATTDDRCAGCDDAIEPQDPIFCGDCADQPTVKERLRALRAAAVVAMDELDRFAAGLRRAGLKTGAAKARDLAQSLRQALAADGEASS